MPKKKKTHKKNSQKTIKATTITKQDLETLLKDTKPSRVKKNEYLYEETEQPIEEKEDIYLKEDIENEITEEEKEDAISEKVNLEEKEGSSKDNEVEEKKEIEEEQENDEDIMYP